MRKTYVAICIICLSSSLTFAQDEPRREASRAATARRRIAELTNLNRQLTEENISLHEYQRKQTQVIADMRDSLNSEKSWHKSLEQDKQKLEENLNTTKNTLTNTNKSLDNANNNITKLQYELEIVQDPNIIRIYDMPISKVREGLLSRLNEESLGFSFDDDTQKGTIKVTKSFDNNAEAWWVFDKTIDILLEISLKLQPHQFDPNRTLVTASTILLEKVRYSNKQFEPQDDVDKIKLYQEKAMRLLEMNIRKQSRK